MKKKKLKKFIKKKMKISNVLMSENQKNGNEKRAFGEAIRFLTLEEVLYFIKSN